MTCVLIMPEVEHFFIYLPAVVYTIELWSTDISNDTLDPVQLSGNPGIDPREPPVVLGALVPPGHNPDQSEPSVLFRRQGTLKNTIIHLAVYANTTYDINLHTNLLNLLGKNLFLLQPRTSCSSSWS